MITSSTLSKQLSAAFVQITRSPWRRTGLAVFRVIIGCTIAIHWAPATFAAHWLAAVAHLTLAQNGSSRLLLALCGTTAGLTLLTLVLTIAGVCLAANLRSRIAAATAWAALALLLHGFPDLAAPGDHFLLVGALPYLVLMWHGGRSGPGRFAIWLHNVAVVGLVSQVTALVLLCAFARAHAPTWHNGTAFYLIAQRHQQPAASFVQEATRNPVFATLATYLVLLGGMWYPLFSAMGARMRAVAVGIFCSMHLLLCAFPALVAPSLLLIGATGPLLSESHYESLRRAWGSVRGHLAAVWAPGGRAAE